MFVISLLLKRQGFLMSETTLLTHEEELFSEKLKEQRLLVEVDNLMTVMDGDGNIPDVLLDDIRLNLETAVYEIAMPLAVSVSSQRVEYISDGSENKRRVINWLGKNAVEVAMGGKLHHRSRAAFDRIEIEVAEARRAQEHLQPGVAQVFISPKMTSSDATAEVAIAEHLYDEDAIRVSYAVQNSQGEVIARRLESLLVRDIPLEAWVRMLKDPNNVFGRSFSLSDEDSALSVMSIFSQLDLPEKAIPDGPVALVRAVLPYITDKGQLESVSRQLQGFTWDQEKYKEQAKKTSEEWLKFETELAKSLRNGLATFDITRYIIGLQHNWSASRLLTINDHYMDGQGYIMTRQLAALLEDSKRQTLNTLAGILTDNKEMIQKIDQQALSEIRFAQSHLSNIMLVGHFSEDVLNETKMVLERKVAGLNIGVKGGCNGYSGNNFNTIISSQYGNQLADVTTVQPGDKERKTWKWQFGYCRAPQCRSPKPTWVGPCSVCERCQFMSDIGKDLTKPSSINVATKGLNKKGSSLHVSGKKVSNNNESEQDVSRISKKDLAGHFRLTYLL